MAGRRRRERTLYDHDSAETRKAVLLAVLGIAAAVAFLAAVWWFLAATSPTGLILDGNAGRCVQMWGAEACNAARAALVAGGAL